MTVYFYGTQRFNEFYVNLLNIDLNAQFCPSISMLVFKRKVTYLLFSMDYFSFGLEVSSPPPKKKKKEIKPSLDLLEDLL